MTFEVIVPHGLPPLDIKLNFITPELATVSELDLRKMVDVAYGLTLYKASIYDLRSIILRDYAKCLNLPK